MTWDVKVVVVFDESIIDDDVGDNVEDEGCDDDLENGLDVDVKNDVVDECTVVVSDVVADMPAVLKVDDDGNDGVRRDAANASLKKCW